MAFKIGFAAQQPQEHSSDTAPTAPQQASAPRKSVVQVYFARRNMTLAYYNDQFDLHRGDLVYVDGKLEGLRGRVVEVNYNFKIKVSDYKRVIAVADTSIHGRFFLAGSHFITFDPTALPAGKVLTWYKAPAKEDDEFASGSDDSSFHLNHLHEMPVSGPVAQRGREYYRENRIKYLCLDGSRGFAIVEGSDAYEVEFTYRNGEISQLTCTCFCSYYCKHEYATMLQLQETLKRIEEHYADEYTRTGYLAVVDQSAFFTFALEGRETGSFTL